MFQTLNPYTQEVLSEYPYTTPAQLTESLEKAKAAFPAWRNAKIADRAAFVMQLAGDSPRRKKRTRPARHARNGQTPARSTRRTGKMRLAV